MTSRTTALTAEQIADFHDLIEEQQDDILADAVGFWRKLARPLPPCFVCHIRPAEIRMELPEQQDGLIVLTFTTCSHAFHADRTVMAEGLRLHNHRRQARQ
ncbi:hypothetical protein ACQEV9_18195 [Streptomyces chartreusis]|uniref:hypothetical protein n=1 Tax=Streptomyces chartreusis TaxID=1969 RepID=UPI003D922290